MKNPLRQAEQKQAESYALVIAELEKRARRILREHPNLDEFVMAMGGWFFTRKIGTKNEQGFVIEDRKEAFIHNSADIAYMKPIRDLIKEWDERLHLTGDPMRFTANGPVVREW